MKTTTFFVLSFLLVAILPCFGFNYTINFTGSGASSSVNSVIVQNLTRGTTVTVPAGNVLNLSDAPNAVEQLSADDETIRVYPASTDGKSMVSFFTKQAGLVQINAFSMDGRKVTGISTDLQAGSNTFELSLPKGVFVIQVTGNEYAYTAKVLNQTGTQGNPGIFYTGTEKPVSSSQQKTKSFTLGVTTMTYTAGDQLLYTAVSGNYNTIVTDVPTSNKTTNFNFVACTDTDGNNYTIVIIGNQTWMAENLKTTRFSDRTAIPLITDFTTWVNLITPGYCWYNNDAPTYKNTYGALYNWYTVNTGKLAPTGWHVPSDAEWSTLGNYLTANGYNYDGSTSGNYYAKSLAATTNWAIDNTDAGVIGNNLSKNNSTGFSALPGGSYIYCGSAGIGNTSEWWSSTEGDADWRGDNITAWSRYLYFGYCNLSRLGNGGFDGKVNGHSVRCIKNN